MTKYLFKDSNKYVKTTYVEVAVVSSLTLKQIFSFKFDVINALEGENKGILTTKMKPSRFLIVDFGYPNNFIATKKSTKKTAEQCTLMLLEGFYCCFEQLFTQRIKMAFGS